MHIYCSPMWKWKNKWRTQIHTYGISWHDSNHHLVNVTKLYMCFISASCFHPATLDLTWQAWQISQKGCACTNYMVCFYRALDGKSSVAKVENSYPPNLAWTSNLIMISSELCIHTIQRQLCKIIKGGVSISKECLVHVVVWGHAPTRKCWNVLCPAFMGHIFRTPLCFTFWSCLRHWKPTVLLIRKLCILSIHALKSSSWWQGERNSLHVTDNSDHHGPAAIIMAVSLFAIHVLPMNSEGNVARIHIQQKSDFCRPSPSDIMEIISCPDATWPISHCMQLGSWVD